MFKKPVVEAGGINIKGNGCGGGFAPKEEKVKLHGGLRLAVEMGAVEFARVYFFSLNSPQQERLGTTPSVT